MSNATKHNIKTGEPSGGSDRKSLHEAIGTRPFLDHIAIPSQPGMLDVAVAFFTRQLGWNELKERAVEGDWGQARFVQHCLGGIIVQITHRKDKSDNMLLPIVHLAIAVQDPSQLVREMKDWAMSVHTSFNAESRGNDKWFVSLQGILGVQLEIVPMEKL